MTSRYLKVVFGTHQYQRRVPLDLIDLVGVHVLRAYGLGRDRKDATLKRDQIAYAHSLLFARLRRLSDTEKALIRNSGGILVPLQSRKACYYLDHPHGMEGALHDMLQLLGSSKPQAEKSPTAPEPSKSSIETWHKRWIDSKAKLLSPSHALGMSIAVRRLVTAIGNKSVRDVSAADIKQFAAQLTALPIKTTTAEGNLWKIVSFFAFVLAEAGIHTNPARGVKLSVAPLKFYEREKLRKQPFTGTQIELILAHFDSISVAYPEDRWIVRLAIYQGMRVEEILQLRVSDITVTDEVPSITISDRWGHLKNLSSLATLPIHPIIREDFLTFVNGLCDQDGLIFSRSAAKGYRKANNFSKRFARVLRNDIKITDPKLTFHSFKHTFATAVARAHLPRHVEYDLCRHARTADAHSVYLHGSKMTVLLNALSSVDPKI